MAFSISFLDTPLEFLNDDLSIPSAIGKLIIGDFEEEFASSLFEWTKQDYESQWLHALQTILNGSSKAALITEYLSPAVSSNLQWWRIYRIGDSIYVQSQILLFDRLSEAFSLEKAFTFVADYRAADEDDNPISTWQISLDEVAEFTETLAARLVN